MAEGGGMSQIDDATCDAAISHVTGMPGKRWPSYDHRLIRAGYALGLAAHALGLAAHASPGPEVAQPKCIDDWACMMPGDCSRKGYCLADDRTLDERRTQQEQSQPRAQEAASESATPTQTKEVAAAIELTDAQVDAAIIRANMDAHKGPFVPIGELTAEQLWAYYRSIARHFYALGLAAGGAQPDRNSHEYYEHHAAPAPSASPGPEVAQDQLAATPLPKGEQRAFVEGAGGSAATHEVATAIERVREYTRDMSPEFHSDVILVCTAASRAPGPKKWPTVLSDEDVERISIDTVLTMGNPESRMALAHAMIRAGFRAALIRESRSGIAKAMTAHDTAEAAPGAPHV